MTSIQQEERPARMELGRFLLETQAVTSDWAPAFAAVDRAAFQDGKPDAPVYQAGPRRLWDEVEAAWRWWDGQGRPGIDRFGLTVTAKERHAWLDDQAQSWAL